MGASHQDRKREGQLIPSEPPSDGDKPPVRKAGVLQVAKILFFVLLMIGKKKTWEQGGEGARMTPAQIVVGAIIGGIVLIVLLITLVRVVLSVATG